MRRNDKPPVDSKPSDCGMQKDVKIVIWLFITHRRYSSKRRGREKKKKSTSKAVIGDVVIKTLLTFTPTVAVGDRGLRTMQKRFSFLIECKIQRHNAVLKRDLNVVIKLSQELVD